MLNMFLRQTFVLSTLLLSTLATPTHKGESRSIHVPDWETFHSLLDEVDFSAVHAALDTLAPKFQHGVFEKDRTAIEQVHSEDPPLASQLVNIAKRQSNTTTTTPVVDTTTTTPLPPSTTTPTTTSEAVSTTPITTTPPATTPTTTTTTTPPASSSPTTSNVVPTTSTSVASSASASSSRAAASSSAGASISSQLSSQIAASTKPPATTVKVAPTNPPSATPIATLSNAVVYSTFGGGLVTITSSAQRVSFRPSTQTRLAYTTLPDGEVQTSTAVVVVNAPVTGNGGTATQTANAASTTGGEPGLQNAAGTINLDFAGSVSVMLAGAVALIMLTL